MPDLRLAEHADIPALQDLIALSGRVRLREGSGRTAEDVVTELWATVFGRSASGDGDGEGKAGAPTGAISSR